MEQGISKARSRILVSCDDFHCRASLWLSMSCAVVCIAQNLQGGHHISSIPGLSALIAVITGELSIGGGLGEEGMRTRCLPYKMLTAA